MDRINIHTIVPLISSITFFVIIIYSLYPKSGKKINLLWILCATSFFLFFAFGFLGRSAPSVAFANKIMILAGYNVPALIFLYPYCIIRTIYGNAKKYRIHLAVILILCFLILILHHFRLLLTQPTLKVPFLFFSNAGPYFWIVPITLGIAITYCFYIILEAFKMPEIDLIRKSELRWLFLTTLLVTICSTIHVLIIYNVQIPKASMFVWIIFILAIAYAIFRHGIFGTGWITTTTIASIIVGTILVASHHLIIASAEKWLIDFLKLSESSYISVLTAFVLVIFVQPLYVRVHHKLDKFFHLENLK